MTGHQQYCQTKALPHSDAAKRVSDTYNLHRIGAGHAAIGRWFAASLAEGTTDNTLYDSRRDCVIHQHHNENYYTFIKIGPHSMTICDAEIMLSVSRRAYDAGMRLADPEDRHGGKELIKRTSVEDQLALSRGRATNLYIPGRDY